MEGYSLKYEKQLLNHPVYQDVMTSKNKAYRLVKTLYKCSTDVSYGPQANQGNSHELLN